jgi:hypothetical protein
MGLKNGLFVFLIIFSISCREEFEVPSTPRLPEKNEAGILSLNSEIFLDRRGLEEGGTIQTVKLEGSAPNIKIYWSWYDPDDPATNLTIDPNGGEPWDDSIKIEFINTQEENGHPYTETDENGYTQVQYRIIYKAQRRKTFPGDNFQIIAVKGSPDGVDSSISKPVYVMKRIWIEYDHFASHPEYGWEADITHYWDIQGDLTKLLHEHRKEYSGNRDVYIRLMRFVDIDENIYEPYEYTAILWDQENESLPEACQPYADVLIDSIVDNGASVNYVHLIGATHVTNIYGEEVDILGTAKIRSWNTAGFSFIFTIQAIWRDALPISSLIYITLHEIGHQIGPLLDTEEQEHTYDCVMNDYDPYDPRSTDPHYGVKCVKRIRNDIGRL